MLASKTIRAELYGLTRFKRKLLEDLQAEWDRAQALERDYRTLREQTRHPPAERATAAETKDEGSLKASSNARRVGWSTTPTSTEP